jgi:hypothetical protein
VATELQEQLLDRKRELSREGAITTWEVGLVASQCTLERVFMERDAEHI